MAVVKCSRKCGNVVEQVGDNPPICPPCIGLARFLYDNGFRKPANEQPDKPADVYLKGAFGHSNGSLILQHLHGDDGPILNDERVIVFPTGMQGIRGTDAPLPPAEIYEFRTVPVNDWNSMEAALLEGAAQLDEAARTLAQMKDIIDMQRATMELLNKRIDRYKQKYGELYEEESEDPNVENT